MEKRKLTKQDIDKVRGIEGFPIGRDEDIIALSDAPYYTACPNPFIEEFIRENGHPYDEDTDDYHREPFASDVSEGKNDPIYMAHTYHTKVPHKAIMHYIMHYTNPGDIVFDGFCGTGMTALAAQMCGSANQISIFSTTDDKELKLGSRKAVISDLSPIATFIAHNYTNRLEVQDFAKEFREVMQLCAEKFGWMYQTHHTNNDIGTINYVVWSDVFICPTCGEELVFWDVAIGEDKTVKNPFTCSRCGSKLKKSNCKRAQETDWDDKLGSLVTYAKQVPVMINYEYRGKKFEKRPDTFDLDVLKKVHSEVTKYFLPHDELPTGDNTAQPIQSHNFRYVNQFYYDRSGIVFSFILETAKNMKYRDALIFLVTSIITKTGSKLHNIGFKDGKLNLAGAMPNVLYVPSTVAERNIPSLLEGKFSDICKIYYEKKGDNDVLIQTTSATETGIPDNIIDYIFTDPPFGANINYSEMNYLWEAWLRVKTNSVPEAIMNKTQRKSLQEYQFLMTKSFSEFYRILKPNRWMTVEFHNSHNAVWNAIQEALQRAGFIIADVRTLDKQQGTFKQMTSTGAVKQDLVISAYKPKDSFTNDFKLKAGTEKTAWSFVRQHLSNLPITVKKGGRLEVIAERQAFLLWDRMVAYHIMRGIAVPMDAVDFYKGLDEKYIKRDGMYFLPSQANKYDAVRATCEVENIQMSLFVQDEKTAIGWLYQQLDPQNGGEPQTYQDLMPKFMQELKAVDKREKMPELMVILEENFLKDDKGRWYIPDYTKSGDIAKLREKNLLKEFAEYQATKGKLKVFRSEAIRAGFAKLWKEKNYNAIVEMAERLPEETIQEDSNLLMYYDISLSRAQSAPTQMKMDME